MAEFGYHTIGGTTNANGGDTMCVSKEVLSEAAELTKLTAYFDGSTTGAAHIRGIIYDNVSGEPKNLVRAGNDLTTLTAGYGPNWFDLTFPSPVSLAAGTYWIGFMWGNGSVTFNHYYDTLSANARYRTRSFTSGPEDPWVSTGTLNQRISIYGTYTGATQQLVPSADSVDGAWTDQANGTSLAAAIDETTASDADFIRSPLGAQTETTRVKLASGLDPLSSTGHIIHWRVRKDAAGGEQINMTVTLRQGGGNSLGAGTQIATFNRNNVDGSGWTTYDETLSSGEADSITDYADLYLEFTADTA